MRPTRWATAGAALVLTSSLAVVSAPPAGATGAQSGTANAGPKRHLVDGQMVNVSWSGLPDVQYQGDLSLWQCPSRQTPVSEVNLVLDNCNQLGRAPANPSGNVDVVVHEGPLGFLQKPCPPAGSPSCAIFVFGVTNGGAATYYYTAPVVISFADRELTLSPTSGPPRTGLTTKGFRFKAGEAVNVHYKTGRASPPFTVPLCNATAGSQGFWSCTGTIPTGANAGPPGAHKISATAPSGKAFASFTRA